MDAQISSQLFLMDSCASGSALWKAFVIAERLLFGAGSSVVSKAKRLLVLGSFKLESRLQVLRSVLGLAIKDSKARFLFEGKNRKRDSRLRGARAGPLSHDRRHFDDRL